MISSDDRRLRLLAIPVFLCLSWLLDCGKFVGPFLAKNEKFIKTQKGIRGSDHDGQVDEKTSWYDQNAAVQALEKVLNESLSPEEKRHWYETPSLHPFPQQIECPDPKKFQHRANNISELEFNDKQKKKLRKQLKKGSLTIRDAFMPWIDKGGFHPDLILHGRDVAGLLISIYEGKLYFREKDKPSAKVRQLAQHLESVMEAFYMEGIEIPNVIFPYSQRSIPPDSFTRQCARYSAVPKHLQNRYDAMPIAGIAMDPVVHTGVALMPNMYFGNLQVWDRYTKQLMDGGKADTKWKKRRKRAFWRGKIDKKLDANTPRLEALQAAARDKNTSSDYLDIALTSGCRYLKEYATNFTRSTPWAPKWLPKSYFLEVTRCGGYKTPHAKYTNYWGQLNLPGSSLGSYSKNLQNLWPTGAAVMIWNQSAVEFYYDTLKTGVSHVWVNETRIEPIAAKLFSNGGKLAQRMGAVGREWFKKHLTGKAIVEYYRQWFDAWAALQRFTPTPEMLVDPCTCAGWIDADGKSHDGVKRCSFCASYPPDIKDGCREMMGTRGMEPSPSIC